MKPKFQNFHLLTNNFQKTSPVLKEQLNLKNTLINGQCFNWESFLGLEETKGENDYSQFIGVYQEHMYMFRYNDKVTYITIKSLIHIKNEIEFSFYPETESQSQSDYINNKLNLYLNLHINLNE